jgi:hypothetical protein
MKYKKYILSLGSVTSFQPMHSCLEYNGTYSPELRWRNESSGNEKKCRSVLKIQVYWFL